MWPLTLDMTRDECRGILRRSELETYSNVISTFRAQGGLSEAKARILRELRQVLHISQERHKAEARRVANDERLCTVAELIAGPNTGHEWSKEGHRNFPLLSRAVSYTALSSIANNAQHIAAVANHLLPLPSQTTREITHDQMRVSNEPPIVTEDPLNALMHSTPMLKRSHLNSESSMDKYATISGPRKKRLSESAPMNHTNMRIQQLYHTHSKTPNPTPIATTSNRKTAPQKRTTKTKSQPRAPKQNRTPKAAAAANNQPTLAYGSSVKTQTANCTDANKSLLGETFPENTLTWTPLQPIAASLDNDHILQTQTFATAITPTSPVQVVFTSHVDVPLSEQPKYQQYPNNLITESTPIHWVTDPPMDTKPAVLQPTIQPTLMPNTTTIGLPPTTTTNAVRPIKLVIPATTRKPNATKPPSTAKPPKAIRRKAQSETLAAKNPPQSITNIVTSFPHQPPPLPIHIANLDANSMQISSITNKLPFTANMNLLNASTKLPTQILQSTNLLPTKPVVAPPNTLVSSSTGNVSLSAGGVAKPKIHVTQQIIVPSPLKPFHSKGNVKLVQSANGSIVLKGTTDIVVPTTSSAAAAAMAVNAAAAVKPSFPKIQLVKGGSASKMILMQKVGTPFGTGIKDGRPMKFNVLPQPAKGGTAAPVLLYDVAPAKTGGGGAVFPQPAIVKTSALNANSVHITEDTPVDILPGENNIILDAGSAVQPIAGNHIILDATNAARTMPVGAISAQQPLRIQLPIGRPPPAKRQRTDEAQITTDIEPTDWEEQLDQHHGKVDGDGVVSKATPLAEMIEEDDGSGADDQHADTVGGYMTSEEANDDDIIQYEGDSTDYQDEFSLDGVPETTKPVTTATDTPPSQSQRPSPAIVSQFANQFPTTTARNGAAALAAVAALPKPSSLAQQDCSQDGDDEDTQDGGDGDSSMIMQMEEIDENGCSQIRNVSLEELVDSGHIILDDS